MCFMKDINVLMAWKNNDKNNEIKYIKTSQKFRFFSKSARQTPRFCLAAIFLYMRIHIYCPNIRYTNGSLPR